MWLGDVLVMDVTARVQVVGGVMEKDARVKKTAAPSVEQINAEHVTQVSSYLAAPDWVNCIT